MLSNRIVLALGALLLVAAPAHAQFGFEFGYNALFFENFTSMNTETNGRLAVGGDAVLRNYGVGGRAPDGDFSLVVGGTLTGSSVGVQHGNVFANALAGTVYTNGPGGSIVVGGPAPIDFLSLVASYTSLSSHLGGLESTAGSTVDSRYGTWTFAAGASGLNVFHVDASSFDAACTVNLTGLDASSTVVINVHGATARTTNCGMFINGGGASGPSTTGLASRVLWNYVDTTELLFRGSVLGSVLAPNALISTGNAQLVGDIVAKGGVSTMEYYARPFDGDLPPATSVTPEPISALLLGTGLAGLAAARRRRRQDPPA